MGWDRGRLRLGYLGHADAVIAVSGACAGSVRRFVPADRLHVVHNGVPMPAPSDDPRPAARQRLGLADSDVAVVSLAHICERKGQTFAVRAMKDLPKRTGVKLFLVGSVEREPEYTTCIESQIREYGLEERVSLLGFRSDVSDLLRAADIMVHTALADPHPRAVVEAMSYGLPVVAFATDGVVETVSDGETGILVRPEDSRSLADAMADLANSPDRRARLGGAGRVRASSMFSAESTARGVEGILDAVLQSRKSTYQRKTP
jgi:glycosyltransferase involved in cell wall biosynthesis